MVMLEVDSFFVQSKLASASTKSMYAYFVGASWAIKIGEEKS